MFPVEAWTRIFEYLDDQSLRAVADTAYELQWVVDQMHGSADPERYRWLAMKGLLRKRHFAGDPEMLRRARMSPILRNMAVVSGHPETILLLTAGSRVSWARYADFWAMSMIVRPLFWHQREFLRVRMGMPESPRDRVLRGLVESRKVKTYGYEQSSAWRHDLRRCIGLETIYKVWRHDPEEARVLYIGKQLRGITIVNHVPRYEPQALEFVRWLLPLWRGEAVDSRLITLMYLTPVTEFTVDDLNLLQDRFRDIADGETWHYPPEAVPPLNQHDPWEANRVWGPLLLSTCRRMSELGYRLRWSSRSRIQTEVTVTVTNGYTINYGLEYFDALYQRRETSSPDIPAGVLFLIEDYQNINLSLIRGPVAAAAILSQLNLRCHTATLVWRIPQVRCSYVVEWWHQNKKKIKWTSKVELALVLMGYPHWKGLHIMRRS